MTHGWRDRAGRLVRVGVGIVLVGGPVGCVGADKSKGLTSKPSMPSSLPPPNIPGAGPMPATAPGGFPASTTSTPKPTPATPAVRTSSTATPSTIPNYNANGPVERLQAATQQMEAMSAQPNQVMPVFPSPTPGLSYQQSARPVVAATPAVQRPAPQPVASSPPPAAQRSPGTGSAGLINPIPQEQPIAVSSISPPMPSQAAAPAMPTAAGPSPSLNTPGPIAPTGPLMPLN